jgi:hypothetical protein
VCSDIDLLRLETVTIWVLTESGRTLHDRSPERRPGPRMSLGRSRSGNAVWLRHEVDDEAAREIERIVATEPPAGDPQALPIHLDDYLRILGVGSMNEGDIGGPIYTLPGGLTFEHPAGLVRSGTPAGDRLVASLHEQGMPEALASLGFVDVGELWEPWCVALDGDEIASIAFTVGMASASAEVGVTSMVAHRGRRYAAAATAGWASHAELRGRTLFYSTSWSNPSSQRVTDRLGLRFIGTRFTID